MPVAIILRETIASMNNLFDANIAHADSGALLRAIGATAKIRFTVDSLPSIDVPPVPVVLGTVKEIAELIAEKGCIICNFDLAGKNRATAIYSSAIHSLVELDEGENARDVLLALTTTFRVPETGETQRL